QYETGRIEASFAQPRIEWQPAADPREHATQLVELVLGEAERTADVAHRAPAAITDHGRRDRGTLAAILAEHVLQHFLAPLVFEINVDVGRLVAFPRQETLEQQVAAGRIDRGDAEAIADRRIGRRA